MKTTKQTTTIRRLAAQLDKDPHELAQRILEAGCEAIDDCIGQGCAMDADPLLFSVMGAGESHHYHHRYTITGIIERMDEAELADCLREADEDECELQEVVAARYKQCVDMELLQ